MKPPEIRPPERSLSDFLEDALEHAEMHARSGMRPDDFDLVAALANDLIARRIGIVSRDEDAYLFVRERQPGVDPTRLQESLGMLKQDPATWPAWTRFVVELVLVERGIDRSLNMLQRYGQLRALIAGRSLPGKARDYVDQTVDAYLFGFDDAAIALACTSFEVLAKHALVAINAMSEAQLHRDRPSAEKLRLELRRADLVSEDTSSQLAYLITARNSLVHGDSRMVSQEADSSLKAISALVSLCEALHPSWPE